MISKKYDADIQLKALIRNSANLNYRSMLFLYANNESKDHNLLEDVGEKIMVLHFLLSKFKAERPSILWCHNDDSSTPKLSKKHLKKLENKIRSGECDVTSENPFNLFLLSTKVKFCPYSKSQTTLGNTYDMCVIQDFDAMTPNLLCRITETVSGGGLIIFLLPFISSLKDLFEMKMKVHSKLKTHSHPIVHPHFNERFILSLAKCKSCLIVNHDLKICEELANQSSLKSSADSVDSSEDETNALSSLMESLVDAEKPLPQLCGICSTVDQAKALLEMVDVLTEKSGKSTVSLTAARGRGKSAALGLAVAAAVYYGTSNIHIVSPSPENLNTFFTFLFKGFDALEYIEDKHYDIIQATNPEFNNAIVKVNVFARHRQVIQYLSPSEHKKARLAELVVIDEAASIPLVHVEALLGSHNVFMASTLQGYEGTGRSLSLKLLHKLRQQSVMLGAKATSGSQEEKDQNKCRPLVEVTLEKSIRYSSKDPVEKWLNDLFCLDATNNVLIPDLCPPPSQCRLYYVNREVLFSGNRDTERFLHQMTSLLVSSHYRNSPDDLQMLSDAPAHHLFVLLPPLPSGTSSNLPSVFCVIQVCVEGNIPSSTSKTSLNQGERPTGDLIPWTIGGQYFDADFTEKTGARIIRVATHPDFQSMGYGTEAVSQLTEYYNKRFVSLDEISPSVEPQISTKIKDSNRIAPRKLGTPLLMTLRERIPECVDYLGVSYGLTAPLFKFWKKSKFLPLYISLTNNKITGEHNCIMVHPLEADADTDTDTDTKLMLPNWVNSHIIVFGRWFTSLLGAQFRTLPSMLALSIVSSANEFVREKEVSWIEMRYRIDGPDLKRLESYARNLSDHQNVTDLIHHLARLYFGKKLPTVHLSGIQACLLIGCGVQFLTIETVAKELNIGIESALGQFNRMIRRLLKSMSDIQEKAVEATMPRIPHVEFNFKPVKLTLDEDLEQTAEEFQKTTKKRKKDKNKLELIGNLSEYEIKGDKTTWEQVLSGEGGKDVSIKSMKKGPRLTEKQFERELEGPPPNKKAKPTKIRSSNSKINKRRK